MVDGSTLSVNVKVIEQSFALKSNEISAGATLSPTTLEATNAEPSRRIGNGKLLISCTKTPSG